MRIYVFFVLLICSSAISSSTALKDKSTNRLLHKVASLSESSENMLTLWVTLDTVLTEKVAVELSERSLKRRSKVDPYNYLMDSRDFTFSQKVLDSLEQSGAEIRHVLYWLNSVSIEIPVHKLQTIARLSFVQKIDLVQKLKKRELFQFEPLDNFKKSPQKSSSIPYGISEFQNNYIKADKLHNIGLTGNGVRIAIFDTGFNTAHPAFSLTTIINTFNFIDNNIDVTQIDCPLSRPQTSHGTMTFGIIGGYRQDTLVGIAHDAEFLLAKTEITCDEIEIIQEEDNWIAAAQWADQQGADIINSSLGYVYFQDTVDYTFADLDGDTPRITAAADIAAEKNILVINSAGNERHTFWNHIVTPSDGDSVIAVGATNQNDSLTAFSSPGPTADGRIKPDISTLGVSVVSSIYSGSYTATAQGTSFSAPLVTGGAALALEHDSTLTADELRDLIRQSGDRFENPDNNYGYGLFDAVKTADIVSFEKPYSYKISQDQVDSVLIISKSRSTVIPTLQLLDTVDGISFTDNGNGTGIIEILPTRNQQLSQSLRIVADVGYFADTTEFRLITSALMVDKLAVGPNPCSDYLNIYFYDPENFESLTIHTVSGEKVWEIINEFQVNADINRIEERWNCNNLQGEVVADGIYIIIVRAGGEQFYQKILKVK